MEGNLTKYPAVCGSPTHFHRRHHKGSLHKVNSSLHREEKQLSEFEQKNSKYRYIIHQIKSQRITSFQSARSTGWSSIPVGAMDIFLQTDIRYLTSRCNRGQVRLYLEEMSPLQAANS